MAKLVPRVVVVNEGACGSVAIDPSAGSAGDGQASMLRQMLEGADRTRREGCVGDAADAPLPAGLEERVLTYPAGTWNEG